MFAAIDFAATITSRFAREGRGSIAIMTGVMFPVLIMLAGGVTDFTRAQAIKAKAQRTLDAAVLSMARSDLTDGEIGDRGPELLKSWFVNRDIGGVLTEAEFSSDQSGAALGRPSEVRGSATVTAPTYFLGIFGRNSLEIKIDSATMKPNALPYEIALVLDVSGSMAWDLGGRPRIERLKESTAALFDVVEDLAGTATPPTISVVPYSTSVNIAGIGTGILNGTSARGAPIPAPGLDVWAAERSRGDNGVDYQLGDESPSASPVPFVTGPEMVQSTPVVRMQGPSNNPATYRAAVQGLVAKGGTAGHLGMIWGIYALSPAWSSVWANDPRPYGQAQKIIVMLTDGEFNTTQGIGGRSTNDPGESNRYFQSACKLAKQKGITIYAVALSLRAPDKAKLNACVRGSGGSVISADSAQSLTDAFEGIARKIGGLRLSG